MSQLEILLRVLLSVAAGGVIGLERQTRHRPAGFRTHILVCLGAATVMILSELLFDKFHAQYGIDTDPSRLAAQVISGIGFLGAGTIIHFGANVKGLTTAASLWAVAAVGLVIGAGFYFLAGAVTAVMLFALIVFTRISKRMDGESDISEIVITLENKPKIIGHINLILAKNEAKIVDMVYSNPTADADGIENGDIEDDGEITIAISLRLPSAESLGEITRAIRLLKGVLDVHEVKQARPLKKKRGKTEAD